MVMVSILYCCTVMCSLSRVILTDATPQLHSHSANLCLPTHAAQGNELTVEVWHLSSSFLIPLLFS